MRKSTAAPLAVLCCLFAASCHRPYARYQPIPVESFRSAGKPQSVAAANDSATVQADDWTHLLTEQPDSEPHRPEAYASSAVVPPVPTVQQRVRQASASLVNSSSTASSETNSTLPQQPRPKPKPGQKKTLREMLGLKPRKKLNWWQRIPWQLKASIPVIGVAIIFAVLHISVLAIIFGLLGALLLIRGLKKSFKVRRPWF
ncbi:hypothetical protein LX87_05154 [Larkinella arboricola]|uniref:Uncharacterized protein n=1 Tax=Larkinella arboricola TaxID=643671 RepID=A0A327WNP0_LARAB|nr:hypothetical protein [Larkinella arboricola]RAJ92187.1 hypothetical protein LX87_05154 [Larkinella arboricola]